MIKDPVCGMEIEERKAISQGFTAEFGGQVRFFCSAKCRDMFVKDPTHHWQPQAQSTEMPKGHTPGQHAG